MAELPVDFRLADTCGTATALRTSAPPTSAGDAVHLLSWYVFLPACVQANSQLPEPAPRQTYTPPARPLWCGHQPRHRRGFFYSIKPTAQQPMTHRHTQG